MSNDVIVAYAFPQNPSALIWAVTPSGLMSSLATKIRVKHTLYTTQVSNIVTKIATPTVSKTIYIIQGSYSFEVFKFHIFPWLFSWPFQVFHDHRFSCQVKDIFWPTIPDKTSWQSFPHHVHFPTQQNYFQNDAFAERKPLPPIQCCFLQTPRDQAFFWIHNNIAFRGRGRGKNRYSYDV